ncbi:CAZyme family GT1 [Purpureocillium lilacinum]|uniref:CAZyme family GT1 n=1 Tax=Purpureocillium lilacinum TaxID=33203 RepID=A0ABR0C3L3_PURLI|nr:CAZyme family GT1 [Purpureocillium lilacinum]
MHATLRRPFCTRPTDSLLALSSLPSLCNTALSFHRAQLTSTSFIPSGNSPPPKRTGSAVALRASVVDRVVASHFGCVVRPAPRPSTMAHQHDNGPSDDEIAPDDVSSPNPVAPAVGHDHQDRLPTIIATGESNAVDSTAGDATTTTERPAARPRIPSLLSPPRQAAAKHRKKSEPFLPARARDSFRGSVVLTRWHTAQGPKDDGGVPENDVPLLLDMEEPSDDTPSSEDESEKKDDVEDADAAAAGTDSKRSSQDESRFFRWFRLCNEHCNTKGKVKKDGRLRITVQETANTGYLAKALGTATQRIAPPGKREPRRIPTPDSIAPQPRLNIVIMVIGSRGDIQPFLKIGKVLKEQYGHRIRVATHPAFRDLVERETGLEFFSVGGDPSELMAFMVKNPGMIPSLQTVRAGEIGKRRDAMATMFEGFWRSCIHATDDEKDKANLKLIGDKDPFVADCIIANPPSFAHMHCAEALGVPLHLVFTFPYTPTQAFPHPLASIKKSNVDPGYTNFISYPLVDMMVWQGLGDLVNNFRVNTLSLDPVSTLWAPGATYRLHVPFTYLWSPGLVPKPADWGDEIDVTGFVFLDLAGAFKPDPALVKFLEAGEKPIYIGFGSIVVDDAERFTDMIFDAIKKAGVRALVSRGWGGFGRDDVPDNIFMLGNVPHDWLFPQVQACVIHGGAGTTAIALKCGLPTMIVPFFGDQHFWGNMVGSSGAGPAPVPYRELTSDKLADGMKYLLTDEAKEAAGRIADDIEKDGDGAEKAVQSFQKHLRQYGPTSLRCSLLKNQVGVWHVKGTNVRLGPLAADILVDRGELSWKKLRLLRHMEWNDFVGPGEPFTGLAGSLTETVRDTLIGIGGAPYRLGKTATKRIKSKMSKSKKKREGEGGAAATGDANGHGAGQGEKHATRPKAPRKESVVAPGPEEYVTDVTHSVGLTTKAIAMAPVSLALALAQGFHNAPRLYGDDTVRRPTRVTGFRSGLIASRREFVYGFYDGITGVVRLPVRGAKANGFGGFVKGTAMGFGGLILKPISAVVGPVGFTLQGVAKQADRWRRHPHKLIRRARIRQGQREIQALRPDELQRVRDQVIEGWHTMKLLQREVVEAERRRGIAGHIDHMMLDTSMMFADADVAKWCLAQLRKGASVEDVLDAAFKNKGTARSWRPLGRVATEKKTAADKKDGKLAMVNGQRSSTERTTNGGGGTTSNNIKEPTGLNAPAAPPAVHVKQDAPTNGGKETVRAPTTQPTLQEKHAAAIDANATNGKMAPVAVA